MPGWSRSRRPDIAIQMAGYSGTPIIQKPGTEPGFCIFVAKVRAINETWSGLKFVIPKGERTKSDRRVKRLPA
jgi:hypothetical protein